MTIISLYYIGSSAFFFDIPGYKVKDYDVLYIMDGWRDSKTNVYNAKRRDLDMFLFHNMSKEEFIQDTLSVGLPMRAGKFLVPEFANYLGMTIDDLKQLQSCFDNMDNKHKYEKIIYDSYIKNNGFFLTDEQLEKAYKEYKKYRPDIYNKTED